MYSPSLVISAILFAFILSTTGSVAPLPKFVGNFSIPNPAFTQIVKFQTDTTSTLFVSSFSGFGSDRVYFIPDIGSFGDLVSIQIKGSLVWPNELTYVSASLFGSEGVLVAGGFLVPLKSNGGIWFSPKTGSTAQGNWIEIFRNSNGFFYHRTFIFDVDADGQLDILSCRSSQPIFGSPKHNLVYFTPNDRSKPTGKWTEHIIGDHCDTYFVVADLDRDGIHEIVSTEYWGENLTIIRTTHPKGSFANPSDLVYNVIDSSIGHAFDVQLTDVNGDGKVDLLVTNHQGTSDTPSGSVYAYEIPSNINLPGTAWTRHTLATDLPVLQPGLNQASPGSARAFHVNVNTKTGKPSIVVAGDGAQKAYLLNPTTTNPQDWTFNLSVLHNCASTVGEISVGDVNNDNIVEIFIPCYDAQLLTIYTYSV